MPAKLIYIHPDNPQPRLIDEVVEVFRDGGIVVYPTDTVYAMGCDIYQNRAIERLSRSKGVKVKKNNFSIICNDLSHISEYAKVSNHAFKTIKSYIPGPFTFILPATNELPKLLQTNRKTIGIRVPNHQVPLDLVRVLGNPIITTSVKDDVDDIVEYPNDIDVIYDMTKNIADVVIAGSWCGMIPSTVVDMTTDDFEVVRQGLGEFY